MNMRTIKVGAITIPVFVIVLLVIGAVAIGVLSSTWQIGSHGTIKSVGLEIYSDAGGNTFLTSIDWGRVDAGGSAEQQAYCMLVGNTPATLSFVTIDYVPPLAEQYMDLTWDYSGAILQPDTIYPLKFILTIASNVEDSEIESFSFDIYITATE